MTCASETRLTHQLAEMQHARDREFIGTRLTTDHLTLWVEGRDQDGPSVSGTSLNIKQVDALLKRLGNLRRAMI